MSLDAERRREETFRREGDAEILEFEGRDGELNDEDDVEVTSLNEEEDDQNHRSSTASTTSSTSTSLTPRRQKRKNGLDVLPEEEDDDVSSKEEILPERKLSENKMLQTDITYGKANKRIQVFERNALPLSSVTSLKK